MLARYRIGKAKYMKGGNKVEYAPPPPGGFEVPPIKEKHNSMSAAIQDNADQNARAAEIQQEINQSGGVSVGDDVPPGESPPGTMEVEGSSVLDPEQNKVMTGLRELQLRSAADDALDAPRPPKKGGARKKRKRTRKKRKRWPPKRKSRRKKKRKGGDPHISSPKLSNNSLKKFNEKGYHNVTQIGPLPAWNPANFTGAKKQYPLWMRHHFENEKKRGGKRKKRTRKKKRRRRKKSRRKKR